MTEVVLLPSAERDLEAIHHYTLAEWGAVQADHYLSGLRTALTDIARFPSMGVEAKPASGVRVWNYKRHRILYRTAKQSLIVSRIFHAARDVDLVLAHYAAQREG